MEKNIITLLVFYILAFFMKTLIMTKSPRSQEHNNSKPFLLGQCSKCDLCTTMSKGLIIIYSICKNIYFCLLWVKLNIPWSIWSLAIYIIINYPHFSLHINYQKETFIMIWNNTEDKNQVQTISYIVIYLFYLFFIINKFI